MNEISSATIWCQTICATGQFYGWPYAYLTPNNLDPRQVQNGKSKRPDKAASTQTPDVLQAHSAALGLQFYDRKTFPKNIATVPLSPFALGIAITAPATKLCLFPSTPIIVRKATTTFTGFLLNPAEPTTWGRPVGLLSCPTAVCY